MGQGDGRLVAAGKLDKPRYTGLFDAFAKIKAAEGMGGFYAGCAPAIQRAALVNLGDLTTYDSAKKAIVVYTGDNLLCHLCSAICSGFVASLCSTPADVAKSRIMSQSALPDGTMPYNGTFDCWRKVVANEGPLALYKGFIPFSPCASAPPRRPAVGWHPFRSVSPSPPNTNALARAAARICPRIPTLVSCCVVFVSFRPLGDCSLE